MKKTANSKRRESGDAAFWPSTLEVERIGAPIARLRGMGWHRFEEIGAWQRAYELCRMVTNTCDRASLRRDEKLREQIVNAARSGPRNIAEGFARWKHGDFAKFTRIAKASEVELLNHFKEAGECGHISKVEQGRLEHAARKAIKAATGLIRWLETHPDP